MRVGIIQSAYIPWKGYFDFIASVDAFVLLDDVQFVRRDWRNRNKIKTKQGLQWLTVPVESKGNYFASIEEIRVASDSWIDDHLSTLRHAYGRARYFKDVYPWLCELYESARATPFLSQVNERLLCGIAMYLNISTPIRRSSDFAPPPGKNERLISICSQLNATQYISGPAASGYIDHEAWAAAGITVDFKSYDGYREYDQLHPPFEHTVSIVDVLFNCGESARDYITSNS